MRRGFLCKTMNQTKTVSKAVRQQKKKNPVRVTATTPVVSDEKKQTRKKNASWWGGGGAGKRAKNWPRPGRVGHGGRNKK